jgi:hypothetical protein
MQDAGALIPAGDEKLARSILDYYTENNLRDKAVAGCEKQS